MSSRCQGHLADTESSHERQLSDAPQAERWMDCSLGEVEILESYLIGDADNLALVGYRSGALPLAPSPSPVA